MFLTKALLKIQVERLEERTRQEEQIKGTSKEKEKEELV